jgi:hypothetical protein
LGDRSIDGECDIKMGLKEIGFKDVGWTLLSFGRIEWQALVNVVLNLQVS